MRQYELTYLISDEVKESDLNKVTGKVGGYISELGGKVTKEEIWGRRKLAYPIQKQEFATYVTLLLNLTGDKVQPLERSLKLDTTVIRHLLIIKDYGKDELALTTDEIAKTEDIEKVIGGERSFEAIEGETEESYDLHSRRKEDQTKEENPSKEIEEKVVTEEASVETEEVVEPVVEPESAEEEKVKEEPKAKKTTKKQKAEETAKPEEAEAKKEADRLSKLDKELDEILGDDL